ncbi:MAG: hypothetical protein WC556_06580 [Candidatus Methanoperedens sp.]
MVLALVYSFVIYFFLVYPLVSIGIIIGYILVKVIHKKASDDSVGAMLAVATGLSIVVMLFSYYFIRLQEHKEMILFLLSLTFLFIINGFMHNWYLENKRIENSS